MLPSTRIAGDTAGVKDDTGAPIAPASRPMVPDYHVAPFAVAVSLDIVSGAPTWKFQHTMDDPLDRSFNPATALWHDDPGMSSATQGVTAPFDGNYAFPVRAIRVYATGGVVKARIIQAAH